MLASCTASAPTAPPLRCGAGTTLDADECVAPPRLGSTGFPARACGAGTRQDGDFCVPDVPDVATIGPCLADKQVMYLDGNDYKGMLTVTVADWSSFSDRKNVNLSIQVGDIQRGMYWTLDFETRFLSYDLIPGIYDMAERAGIASPGHPGIAIDGAGRACDQVSGRFQVHDIDQQADGKLKHLLVSFEQRCDAGATPLVGCVGFQP
jgi:hypothetical protein